jgi:anti-sigma regulatory factor (Ser/Thr protein kinase)
MRDELLAFTGKEWQQEDDVTMVVLYRKPVASVSSRNERADMASQDGLHLLAEWTVASSPGNERQAKEQVASIVEPLSLQSAQVENLKTAVAEVVMNAMEHGNSYQSDKPVTLQVLSSQATLSVRIRDEGGGPGMTEPELPDIDAKLAGLQSPRGWGLFLIEHLVDEMRVTNEEHAHIVELILRRNQDEMSRK